MKKIFAIAVGLLMTVLVHGQSRVAVIDSYKAGIADSITAGKVTVSKMVWAWQRLADIVLPDSGGGGGSTYYAGYGLDLTGFTFKADTFYIASKGYAQKMADTVIEYCNSTFYLASNPAGYLTGISSLTDTFGLATRKYVQKKADSVVGYVTNSYFPTADTIYLFRKADSNTKGHAATFNLVTDTAAALRAIITSGTVTSVSSSLTSIGAGDISLIINTATTTPQVSLNVPTASGSQRGALNSTDWNKFDGNRIGAFFTSIPYSILNTSMSVTVIATTTQTITGWYVCGDQSGSITVGITDNASDMISTGNHPLLSSAQTNNAAVSGWTSTTITAGHVYKFTISGITSLQSLSVQLTTTL